MHTQSSQEIRETPSTLGQEQGQGKHVGAVGSDDEVEDGWLLLEKKKAGGGKKRKKRREEERKSQPYGLRCRPG